ncbi:class I SAM-dependent methyltransferase, partial [Pseudoalteromonas piscicida]
KEKFNSDNNPLSSPDWLRDHHNAKLNSRHEFAKKHLVSNAKTLVDLGCGTGLWLDIYDKLLPESCDFFGLDESIESLRTAEKTAENWKRETSFAKVDLSNSSKLPKADIYLAFNIFPYLKEPQKLLEKIKLGLNPGGKLIIRQYDGFDINFGPMEADLKLSIHNELFFSLSKKNNFKHYERDSIFKLVTSSGFNVESIYFDRFEEISPYSDTFKVYLKNTIAWMKLFLTDVTSTAVCEWEFDYLDGDKNKVSYFKESYLVAIMS